MEILQGSKIVTIKLKNNSKEKINIVWRSAQPEDLCGGIWAPNGLSEEPQYQKKFALKNNKTRCLPLKQIHWKDCQWKKKSCFWSCWCCLRIRRNKENQLESEMNHYYVHKTLMLIKYVVLIRLY